MYRLAVRFGFFKKTVAEGSGKKGWGIFRHLGFALFLPSKPLTIRIQLSAII